MPGPASDWSFVSVDLELTNRCGNRCALCPRQGLSRPVGDMNLEVFETVSSLLGAKGSLVSLSGMGDPLLHPELAAFTRILRQRGADVRIVAHASSLVRPGAVEILVEAGPNSVLVSFPSCRRTLFEALCPGVDYDQALASVLSLTRAAEGRFGLQVSGILTLQNPQERDEFVNFWKQKGLPAEMTRCHGRGGHLKASPFYAPGDRGLKGGSCGLFRFHSFVTWEADVLACCHDLAGETRLGNLLRDSIELLAARKAKIARSGRPFDLCARCDEPLRAVQAVRGVPPSGRRERRKLFRRLSKTRGPS